LANVAASLLICHVSLPHSLMIQRGKSKAQGLRSQMCKRVCMGFEDPWLASLHACMDGASSIVIVQICMCVISMRNVDIRTAERRGGGRERWWRSRDRGLLRLLRVLHGFVPDSYVGTAEGSDVQTQTLWSGDQHPGQVLGLYGVRW
jgi:hypothetical protein